MIKKNIAFNLVLLTVFFCCNFATCKYGFKDTAPIPIEVKTFRVNYIENKASYVFIQLNQELTEKLKQKLINNTRLKQINTDEADYQISGYVSQYNTSTLSVSNNISSGNRITVGFHLIFKNKLDEKKNFESDITQNFDYPATQDLQQAQADKLPKMVTGIVDEVFNKIFSNW